MLALAVAVQSEQTTSSFNTCCKERRAFATQTATTQVGISSALFSPIPTQPCHVVTSDSYIERAGNLLYIKTTDNHPSSFTGHVTHKLAFSCNLFSGLPYGQLRGQGIFLLNSEALQHTLFEFMLVETRREPAVEVKNESRDDHSQFKNSEMTAWRMRISQSFIEVVPFRD